MHKDKGEKHSENERVLRPCLHAPLFASLSLCISLCAKFPVFLSFSPPLACEIHLPGSRREYSRPPCSSFRSLASPHSEQSPLPPPLTLHRISMPPTFAFSPLPPYGSASHSCLFPSPYAHREVMVQWPSSGTRASSPRPRR